VTSYSLPKSQTPIFLPLNWSTVVMLLSFQDTERVPERWKIWAMLTRSQLPLSTATSALGTQPRVNSGPSGAQPTVMLATFGPPSRSVTVRFSAAEEPS